MTAATRLVTFVDVADQLAHTVSVSARHEIELADGRRVLLLDDRGWGTTLSWATATEDDLRETARVVVGPDEPFGDRTPADMAADHWASLRRTALRQGADLDAAELSRLPHDVVLSERVRARVPG